jgi:hypothetical protein
MSLLSAPVSFGPDEVRAVANGAALPRCVRFAVLTSQTCGEACWHAKEDVCRCSCGGKNHGCLLVNGAKSPERTAKIDGVRYVLVSVGRYGDLQREAAEINGAQWARVEKPFKTDGGWFMQYRYSWGATDKGAPARLKNATADQLSRWPELSGWRSERGGACLLWKRTEMPPAPTELCVDKQTGLPRAEQSPNEERALLA